MLSVLAFKRSLFAGVLDGGESEIFLGGTRLTKFMEGVDAVTRRDEAPQAEASPVSEAPKWPPPASREAAVEGVEGVAEASEASPGVVRRPGALGIQAAPEGENLWAPLLNVGLKLLEAMAKPPPREVAVNGAGNGSAGKSHGWIETDPATGRSVLKLPVPEPEVVKQLAQALSRVLAGLQT